MNHPHCTGYRTDFPGEPLRITVSPDTHNAVLTIAGEIDLHTLPTLQAALDAAHPAGHDRLRLNLAEVSFMSASALRIIERTHHEWASTGGQLVLIDPSPRTLRLLTLAGLDTQLHIH